MGKVRFSLLWALVAGLVFVFTDALALASEETELRDLRKEVEALRKSLSEKEKEAQPASAAGVDAVLGKKFGPQATVATRDGKLELGGLLQIWNYHVDGDTHDIFDNHGNDAVSHDTYRIRRAELRFKLDISENITARVMVDPAQEATSFPGVPSNQGLFKSQPANPYIALGEPALVADTAVGRVTNGAGTAPRLLQDAYFNFHGLVPHHDFQLGQFLPPTGEEGIRDNAYLDFAERAMVTQFNQTRDLGAQVHGTWVDNRLQYWLGVFDGAGNFFGTAGNPSQAELGTFSSANRSDDNSNKDFAGRLAVRPVWNADPWGNLEIGASLQCGKHGSLGDPSLDASTPINGLNENAVFARREAAWVHYKPLGPVHGWWLRGEWGLQHDRTTPFSVNAFGLGSGPDGAQAAPAPFTRQGWYVSTGYKLSDSIFAERLDGGGFWNDLLKPVEFAFRYEQFQNIIVEDPAAPDTHTLLFNTKVITLGVNYYIKAYNMRVQLNGMIVNEPQYSWSFGDLREVRNNVLLLSYQVLF